MCALFFVKFNFFSSVEIYCNFAEKFDYNRVVTSIFLENSGVASACFARLCQIYR